MTITTGQLRAARGLIGWTQQDLADKSEAGRAIIADFESGKRTPYATTLTRMQETLIAAGVEFIPENSRGAGVRLKKSTLAVEMRDGEAGIIDNNEM
ncbi:helix-turn-helix domain-containing protein (plasmid) [Mesorhizobium sp. INR15]|nr:helix-turn-helix domain-containing protein [Mesorhizobium sp. INR15]